MTDANLTVTMTSSVTSFPVSSDATFDFDEVAANLSLWHNISADINTTAAASPTLISIISSFQSAIIVVSYARRLEALSICYVVCSLGALLLALCTLDGHADDRRQQYRQDKSWRSASGVARLVLGSIGALIRRQDVALLSPLALFVGAQQMFAYFTFIQVSRNYTDVFVTGSIFSVSLNFSVFTFRAD